MTRAALFVRRFAGGFAAAALLFVAACNRNVSNPVPPRVTAPARIPELPSTDVIPITAPLAALGELINAEVPPTLLAIDREEKACIPAQRITACVVPKIKCRKGLKCRTTGCEIGLDKAKITDAISCRIVGAVTRGPIRLSGAGNRINLAMPVDAQVSARDIGHILKGETATASAEVRAVATLGIVGDWQPTAKIDIDYDWTDKPGIELLGQRITFAGRADPQLAKVVARLEADLPRHLARLQPRARLEAVWARAFTSVDLNHRNPPVWLRITPRALRYDGYRIEGDRLVLDVAAMATTETFVGARPPDPMPTPLPPPAAIPGGAGFRLHLPVVADYRELEPVLEKALRKLSAKGIEVPRIGRVHPRFGKVTMYTTTGNRLAIGVALAVASPGRLLDARGTVWATGQPYNEPGSQRVLVRDLQVTGAAASPTFALLLAVVEAPSVRDTLRAALTQNFARDYAKLRGKVDRAITEKRIGDFVLRARIEAVQNGVVMPVGQGVYMPVDATGTGTLRYLPVR